jgi:8-oxo-dGTP diphosphatase
VAAGILCDAEGRVLITERVGDAAFAGLWEFPGGKIDTGETAEMALSRELNEELGIGVDSFERFKNIRHDYPDRCVDIDFFLVNRWTGEPRGLQGQKLQWVPVDTLDEAILLPADAPLVRMLKSQVGRD